MMNSKTARIVAFVGTLGASAALVGTAASSTGAYFTDSKDGKVNASSGHLTLDRNNSYDLAFDNLVPGEDKDRVVGYHTGGDTATDVWLAIPDGAAYAKLTGAKGTALNPGGGLGRYGHFAVSDNDGNPLFSSYNLQNESDTTSGCADADGHGFGPKASSVTDTPPLCGVPHFIKLASNVPSGTDGRFTMTFGLTGRAAGQGAQVFPELPFKVTATQHGVRPDAANF